MDPYGSETELQPFFQTSQKKVQALTEKETLETPEL
jgi:hypothetical protein